MVKIQNNAQTDLNKVSRLLFRLTQPILAIYLVAIVSSMAGMEIFAWLLFLIWVWSALCLKFGENKNILVLPPFTWVLLGFWVTIVFGAILNPEISVEQSNEIMVAPRWIVLFITFSHIFYYKSMAKTTVFKVLIVASLIVSVYSLIQVFTGLDLFRAAPYKASHLGGVNIWRAKGFFSNAITFANVFSMLFCFLSGFFILSRDKFSSNWRKIIWLSLGVMAITLILSFTRGAWLGLFVAIFFQTFYFSYKRALAMMTVFVLLFTAGLCYSPVFRDRVESSFDASEKPIYARVQLWKAHWAMFKENPLTGIGYEMSMERVQEFHQKSHGEKGMVGHAHNNFLQVLATTGIFGFTLYIILFFLILKSIILGLKIKETRALFLGLLGAFVCFHVAGITESSIVDGEVEHMHSFLLAILASEVLRIKQRDVN